MLRSLRRSKRLCLALLVCMYGSLVSTVIAHMPVQSVDVENNILLSFQELEELCTQREHLILLGDAAYSFFGAIVQHVPQKVPYARLVQCCKVVATGQRLVSHQLFADALQQADALWADASVVMLPEVSLDIQKRAAELIKSVRACSIRVQVPGRNNWVERELLLCDDARIFTNQIDPINPALGVGDINFTATVSGHLLCKREVRVCETLYTDSLRAKTGGGAIEVGSSLCLEEGVTLSANRMCAKTLGGAIEICSSICLSDGMTLSLDRICAKDDGGVIEFCSALCLEASQTFSVNTIASKTPGFPVSINDDLCIVGTVITNTIQSKFGGVVAINDNLCVVGDISVDRIEPKTGPTTEFVSICIDENMTLSVDNIVAKTDGAPVQIDSSLCLDPTKTLSVNTILPKTDNIIYMRDNVTSVTLIVGGGNAGGVQGTVCIGGGGGDTNLGELKVGGGGGDDSAGTVCIGGDGGDDATGTLKVGGGGGSMSHGTVCIGGDGGNDSNGLVKIGGGAGANACGDLFVGGGDGSNNDGTINVGGGDAANNDGTINIGGGLGSNNPGELNVGGGTAGSQGTIFVKGGGSDLGLVCVEGIVQAERFEPKTGPAVEVPSLCVDAGNTASIDRICAKTDGGAIEICSSLCLDATRTLSVNTIQPKTPGGPIMFGGSLCLDPTHTLSVNTIASKTPGAPVQINDDLCVTGNILVDTLEGKTGDVVIVDDVLCVNDDLQVDRIVPKTGPATQFVSICIDENMTLSVDNIAGKLAAVQIDSSLCLDETKTLSVNTILPKSGNIIYMRDNVTTITLIVGGGTTGDTQGTVIIGGGPGGNTDGRLLVGGDTLGGDSDGIVCIGGRGGASNDGVLKVGGGGGANSDGLICVGGDGSANSNGIVKIGGGLGQNNCGVLTVGSGGGQFNDGTINVGGGGGTDSFGVINVGGGGAINSPGTINVGDLSSGNQGGIIVDGGNNNSGFVCVDGTIQTRILDCKPPLPAIDVQCSMCIDATYTLSVDTIQPKTPGGVVMIPSLNIGQMSGDLCVSGSLVTNVLESKSTGTIRIASNVCIDTGMTLSVDTIASKTLSGPVTVCSDLCIKASNTLLVDNILPKTFASPGTILMSDGVNAINLKIGGGSMSAEGKIDLGLGTAPGRILVGGGLSPNYDGEIIVGGGDAEGVVTVGGGIPTRRLGGLTRTGFPGKGTVNVGGADEGADGVINVGGRGAINAPGFVCVGGDNFELGSRGEIGIFGGVGDNLGLLDLRGDACLTGTLKTDWIEAKKSGNVRFLANVCIDQGKTLSVDKIAPKNGDTLSICSDMPDMNVFIGDGAAGNVEVEVGDGADSAFVVIGDDAIGGAGLFVGPQAGEGGIFAVFSPGSSSTSESVYIDGSLGVCIGAALTLSVDRICAKTDGGAIDICTSLCLDATHTLSVDTILPKTIASPGTINMSDGINHIILQVGGNGSGAPGTVKVGSNDTGAQGKITIFGGDDRSGQLTVEGKIVTDCIDVDGDICLTGSVLTDTICAKLGGGSILICDHVCIEETKTLSVNRICPKESTGELIICDNLKVEGDVCACDFFTENGGGFCCESDSRVKTEVGEVDIDGMLANILTVTVRSYKFLESFTGIPTSTQPTRIGFVGQELLSVFPDVVTNDATVTGNDLTVYNNFHRVNPLQFGAMAFAGIQALDKRFSDSTVTTTFAGHVQIDRNLNVDGAFTNPSDVRVKDEVAEIDSDSSLERIRKLKPKTYKFTEMFSGVPLDLQPVQRGFIAQEIEQVIPEVVFTTAAKRTLKDGEAETVLQDFKGIDYSRLVVDLVGALQASHEKVLKSEERIEALEKQLNEIVAQFMK